jgi:hypothetical protein
MSFATAFARSCSSSTRVCTSLIVSTSSDTPAAHHARAHACEHDDAGSQAGRRDTVSSPASTPSSLLSSSGRGDANSGVDGFGDAFRSSLPRCVPGVDGGTPDTRAAPCPSSPGPGGTPYTPATHTQNEMTNDQIHCCEPTHRAGTHRASSRQRCAPCRYPNSRPCVERGGTKEALPSVRACRACAS